MFKVTVITSFDTLLSASFGFFLASAVVTLVTVESESCTDSGHFIGSFLALMCLK